MQIAEKSLAGIFLNIILIFLPKTVRRLFAIREFIFRIIFNLTGTFVFDILLSITSLQIIPSILLEIPCERLLVYLRGL